MGLDMYLKAKRFIWHNEEELAKKIAANFPGLEDKQVNAIEIEAAYWRKANAIHKWFVDTVQDGNDDCGYYEVSRDQLKELLVLVEEVLADPDSAPNKLPTTKGFFFGSVEYGDWFFEDLRNTKTMLTDCLDPKWKGWYFEYRSSW